MFFVADVYAQAASASEAPSMIPSFAMLFALFIFMYFLIIRPQRKRCLLYTSDAADD